MPARHRAAIEALWRLDAAMAEVVRTTSQPMVGAIRLAWWRERLEEIEGKGPRGEPRLQAVAAHLLPIGIVGRELAELEAGWLALLEPFPWDSAVAEAVSRRGKVLFGLGARILGDEAPPGAGEAWALVDVARHCSDAESRGRLLGEARQAAGLLPEGKVGSPMRPLTALVRAALRDVAGGEPFEAEGTPGRAWAMLRHRITGRLPRLD